MNRQAALLSFTYNCGPRWFGAQGFDTLSTALKAGQLEAVPAAMPQARAGRWWWTPSAEELSAAF